MIHAFSSLLFSYMWYAQKFGRRVQRMEDDGTVNMMKEPASTVLAPVAKATISDGDDDDDDDALVDLDSQVALASGVNYGSLKNLLPEKRLTWTKLDFKGASVVDDRRMKGRGDGGGSSTGIEVNDKQGSSSVGLKALLPVRPTWTKLDFHGASVEDERRTKKRTPTQSSITKKFNEGQNYSNLTSLLPARTITFRKGQVFSSGSATMVNSNIMRSTQSLGRQDRMMGVKKETNADDDEVIDENEDNNFDSMQGKSYTNLKDLLPERKISWRTIK